MKNDHKQRTLIGVVINEPDLDFYSKTMYYIQKEIFAHDSDAAIFNTLLTQEDQFCIENSVFSLINPKLIDGLLVFGGTIRSEEVSAEVRRFIDHSGIPAIYVETDPVTPACVMFDNDECTDKVVRHLTEWHNVRDVCYVSGPEKSLFHQRLLTSFRKSFAEQGIDLTEDRVFYGNDWVCDFGIIANDIIRRGLPEAIVCCSDFTAAGMLGALSERGVDVPEDVIVTGYSRNEPFASDYVNITGIERRPETMAVEAVRRLMSAVTGEEYVPAEKKPCCVLRKGVTCGCERIDYAALARSAMDNMVSTRRDGFDSYYNVMSENLISAVNMDEFLWRLDWYTKYLGDFEGFWLCLNDGIMHVPGDKLEGYSETMYIPYSHQNGAGAVPGGAGFNRQELLPAIFESRDKPMAFIFNCLHFRHVNYGYTVLSYGDTGAFFDRHYVMWLRYTAIAIDKQRRHMLYNDTVSEDQVRDPLTGLLNVRGYKNIMKQRCGKFNFPDKLMRIISVDVENLRGINSAYGYGEGDRVLQRLGMVLNNSAGDDDICVRVSGDEFFICGLIDAAVPVDDVPGNLERNLDAFNTSSNFDYGVHFYTSRVTAPVTTPDILDTLPYEANYQRTLVKDNHNKKRRVISNEDGLQISDNFDPEERKLVSKMLNDNLLTYHFQPIVSAKTGDIVAYEALMRSGGDIKLSPISILNHAAAMGRLDDVERHTMHNLFKFCHDNKEQLGDRQLFINSIPSCTLSDKEFEELCDNYSDILDRIVIEFTEQTEASRQQLDKVIERRDRRGFGIAIDDYGTGYSNISSLLTFMPNCVKIDRSLIMNIHEDKRKQHFAQNIIDYGHDNNFRVLAEGVEKSEELRALIGMGIDLIQGYLTARPAPKPVTMIRPDIRDKIRECNRISESVRVKKTFFTSEAQEISLMSLDFDNYTEVFVTSDECTLKGTEGYDSALTIRIKDGLDCTLRLVNAHLSCENNDACIIIGRGSRLTLEIVGDCALGGPVSVTAGAWLDIVGDGDLTMTSATNQSYGIGADPLSSYGGIGVHLCGKLDMKLDGECCIGIGGGYSNEMSRIDIDCNELNIELAGKHLVCVGSSESETAITVRNTKMKLSNRCVSGIAIGSSAGKITAVIENSELIYDASGDTIAGICSTASENSLAVLKHCNISMLMRAKNIVGIGSEQGAMSVLAENCDLNVVCEGAKAIGIGCFSTESTIALKECRGKVSVSSSQGAAVTAADGRLIIEGDKLECLYNA
ncbi:EAL domain-containing protein [Ruminococcus albus]|uniref:EAL domain-containing protein n=1 Tax=Ruminococcus albus TaxID=1264 RepID=UPI001D1420C3|nr:EAL domain-containing protein [Ruminococcus albus]MCC3350149.1 EAL domain-containing protein [Ruminococcus albus 8]